jgi:hypothetical protein
LTSRAAALSVLLLELSRPTNPVPESNMRAFPFLAAVAAASSVLAAPAAALPMRAAYSGVVTTSSNAVPAFGVGLGEDLLVGRAASIQFTYDVPPPGEGGRVVDLESWDSGRSWYYEDTVEWPYQAGLVAYPLVVVDVGGETSRFRSDVAIAENSASRVSGDRPHNSIWRNAGSLRCGDVLCEVEVVAARYVWTEDGPPLALDQAFAAGGTPPSGGVYMMFRCLVDDLDECEELVSFEFGSADIRVEVIPLPGTLPLLAGGLVAASAVALRRRRRPA